MGAVSDEAPSGPREPALDRTPAGDSASAENIHRLQGQLTALHARKAAYPSLKRASTLIAKGRHADAATAAEEATRLDPALVQGWHLLAISRESLGDWTSALEAYERALALDPANPAVANDLGRLAYRMGMLPQAEALFRHHVAHEPERYESANNLACVLRDQLRFDEAVEVLRPVIQVHPDKAMLWNTLGSVLSEMGDSRAAETFYDEALRLDPRHARARYNLSAVRQNLGRTAEAIEDCRAALKGANSPGDATMMRFALSTMLLADGELEQGWEAYEARLEPSFNEPVHFLATAPQWTPSADLAGRHLLLIGEQGLGDEVLFANTLDDVIAALGPQGRLSLAVEERLVPLFRRSYPDAAVGPHRTLKHHGCNMRSTPFAPQDVDLWAPLGAPLRQFRLTADAFPERPDGFLRPDPARVEHWRRELAGLPGLKVGLLWTSMIINAARFRHFSPFEDWAPVLKTQGVSFVNLQYGDQAEALERARREFGVEIYQPSGIDLKNDLDDVAALSCALDLVVGISNATFNIAAACGAPAWLITTPGMWPRLGADRYLWYSQTRMFSPDEYNNWSPFMQGLAEELAAYVSRAA
jgi:tetratricopeptide (TPR) repeat protein